MFSIKKRFVVVCGVLLGFAFAFQNQLETKWRQLQQGYRASQNNSPESDTRRSSALGELSLGERGGSSSSGRPSTLISNATSKQRNNRTHPQSVLRIGSFNLQSFGDSKLKQTLVVESIARIVRQLDVVALQSIQSRQLNLIPELVDKVNQSDRRYEYCIGPRVGSEGKQQQFAFVFDTDRIETDRQMLYTVDDPEHLLEFEPLVAWFRYREAPWNQAFTFTLVNLWIDPLNEDRERKLLPDLIHSVQKDGRQEDDIILCGDFGCSSQQLTSLKNIGMIFALEIYRRIHWKIRGDRFSKTRQFVDGSSLANQLAPARLGRVLCDRRWRDRVYWNGFRSLAPCVLLAR
jgi:endonuclease/exonuclease/phosphatase family metal-dependent hydrolase